MYELRQPTVPRTEQRETVVLSGVTVVVRKFVRVLLDVAIRT
jgi:hypothetical protein